MVGEHRRQGREVWLRVRRHEGFLVSMWCPSMRAVSTAMAMTVKGVWVDEDDDNNRTCILTVSLPGLSSVSGALVPSR
jgi:hypothetical protein